MRATYFAHSAYLGNVEIKNHVATDLFDKRIASLSFSECDAYIQSLEESLKLFSQKVIKIQREHPEMISVAVYTNPIMKTRYVSSYQYGYSDEFYDYMYKSDGNLLYDNENINKQYFKVLKDTMELFYKLKDKISSSSYYDEEFIYRLGIIINENPFLSDITRYQAWDTDKVEKMGKRTVLKELVVFSEEIPSLKVAREKLKALQELEKDVELYKPLEQSDKHHSESDSVNEKLTVDEIMQLPDTNKNRENDYVILDEYYDEYYDRDGNLKPEFKELKENNKFRKEKEKLEMNNQSEKDLLYSQSLITVQHVLQPMKQRERAVTYEFFTLYSPSPFFGRTNTASLNTLYGESSPQSPIIGGSRSVTLAGQEGERAVVETGSETPVEEISGSNSEVLPTLSGESHQVEVTYNTSSQSVTEVTPKAPAMPATPAEAEPGTEARDRSYQIHKANEAIGFANEMVNSVQFYKYQADFDATRATELESEIKVARVALENFLSNPADEAFTDAMVDAQVDRLEVLEANLKTMKEAYAQTVNAKINDVIGQFNEAVNVTKYKLANTEYQEGVDDVFEQLYGEGKQLTVALDNLLAEGLVDLNQVHYALLQLEEVIAKVGAIGHQLP